MKLPLVFHSMKIPIIVRRAYRMLVEPLEFGLVIHVDVHQKWTKTLFNEMFDNFQSFLKLHGRPVYAVHHYYQDQTHFKFLLKFGFEPLGITETGWGEECILFRACPELTLP